MKHIADAKKEGFTIDYHAAGRPVAYKGPRFQLTELHDCYTELESKLLEVIREGADLCAYEEPNEMVVAGFRARCREALQ